MDEQPIDDFFRRKLYDAEIKPRAEAWAALKARRRPSRPVPMWTYMAVAASLLVVGAFGWWAMQSRDGAATSNSMSVKVATQTAAKNTSPRNEVQIVKTDQITSSTTNEQLQSVETSVQKSFRQPDRRQISGKSPTAVPSKADPHAEVNIQQEVVSANKAEKPRFDAKPVIEPIPEVAVTKEQQKDVSTAVSERTLIVSISVPAKAISIPTVAIATNDSASHRAGLGGLIRKVKRIKDGDVFALSATNVTKTNRRGFGKFYDDVKESIKNNSVD